MTVELVAHTPNPSTLIYNIGRHCYGHVNETYPDSADVHRFIKARMKERHMSIFEHASATFYVSGISRACSHQIVRHRMASYTQISQRYTCVDLLHGTAIIPDTIRQTPEALAMYQASIAGDQQLYNSLLSLGIPREDARFVLPNAAPTSLYWTMNFREAIHVIKLRTSKHAQWEIRNVVNDIHEILKDVAPSIFRNLDIS